MLHKSFAQATDTEVFLGILLVHPNPPVAVRCDDRAATCIGPGTS
jgi:hypothetical protein